MEDLNYNHLNDFHDFGVADKVVVSVDRECLRKQFGSDGTSAGDEAALERHLIEISAVVARKTAPLRLLSIRITAADFER